MSSPNRTMSHLRRSNDLSKPSSHLGEPASRPFALESHLAGQASELEAPVMSSVLAVECPVRSDGSSHRFGAPEVGIFQYEPFGADRELAPEGAAAAFI